jgi:hypothetical protein
VPVTWQDATTALIVLVALSCLAYWLWRFVRRKGLPSCSCCPKCPAEQPERTLVKLDERPGTGDPR